MRITAYYGANSRDEQVGLDIDGENLGASAEHARLLERWKRILRKWGLETKKAD